MAGGVLAAWLVCFGGDAASTHLALSRYQGREVVLPTQNPWLADGLLAGQAAGGWWVTGKIKEKGHPRLALGMRIGLAAVHGYAAVHNIRAMQAGQKRDR